MRFVVFGDSHLGKRPYNLYERESDFYHQYYEMLYEIEDLEPDFIINTGDLFDVPNPKPYPLFLGTSINNLKIPVFHITGNHEWESNKNHFSPVNLVGEELNHFTDHSLKVELHGVNYSKHMKDDLENIVIKYPDYYQILVIHAGISPFINLGNDLDLIDLEPERFDFIACGHLHERILHKTNNYILHYPGSLLPVNKGEIRDANGFTVVDVDENMFTETKYVNIEPVRLFYNITLPDTFNEVKERISDLKTHIGDDKPLIVFNLSLSSVDKDDIINFIKSELDALVLYLKFDISYNEIETISLNDEDNVNDEIILDLIHNWVKTNYLKYKNKFYNLLEL